MSAGTILVVEDNPITRKMLCVALGLEGYAVLDAGDGRAGLELAAARRPDLLVLDYVLPDMDGLQLLAEVRRKLGPPDVPAIVLTVVAERGIFAGLHVQEILAKPVSEERLVASLTGAGAARPDGVGDSGREG